LDKQGRNAATPWQMPRAAWISVVKRAYAETTDDNIGLIAAGVAFYGFLALVPLLGAVVLVYGIAASPETVIHDMTQLTAVMPRDMAQLVGEQLMNVVKTSDGKKGLGLLLALALALFGARNGAGAIVTALNVAYEEHETRNFLRVNLLSLAITAAGVVVAMIALVAVAALGYLESLFPGAPEIVLVIGKIVTYALFTLAGAAAAATLYRYGPARTHARWVWLTPGSLFAAVMWLLLTIGFGIYVANFGNYNATYGSLGAVVVTLTWLYLSSYILLFGAELNAELEHQTAEDTTNADAPIGERGAWVADHVAASPKHGKKPTPVAPPVPARKPAPAQPSVLGDFATSRITTHVGAVAGLPRIGWAPSAAATLGLSLMRRGRGVEGAALLGGTAAAMWLMRDKAADRAIKAVFFDVDGTLVDSNDLHVAAWDEAFRGHGFVLEQAAIRGQIGKGGDLLIPALLPEVSEDMQKALNERQGKIFKQRYLDGVCPFNGASELIRHVHASGQRVVLASSAETKEVRHYVGLLGVGKAVDETTSVDDVETSKPAGDIFASALNKVKPLAPHEVIVVGDTPYDVEAASKCGIRTVALRSGGFDDAVLLAAGAAALYDDAADLLRQYDASPLGG
jgi:YihY family inner membrane protein